MCHFRNPLRCSLSVAILPLLMLCPPTLHAQATAEGAPEHAERMFLTLFGGAWFLPVSETIDNGPAVGGGATLRYGLSAVFSLQAGVSVWRTGSDGRYDKRDGRGNYLGTFTQTATSVIVPVEAGVVYTPELDAQFHPWISLGIGFYPAFSSGTETLTGGGATTEELSTSPSALGLTGSIGAAYNLDEVFSLTLEIVYRGVSFGSDRLATWQDSLSGASVQAGVRFAL
jgi:hypothetical protein